MYSVSQKEIKNRSAKNRPMGVRIKSACGGVVINCILILFSITCIFPIIWLFYSSLKTSQEFSSSVINLSPHPSFRNYMEILRDSQMSIWMLNTVRNTAISLFFIIFLGFIIGYFLSRFDFKGRGLLHSYYLLGLVIPINALMVPMYIWFKNTGLTDKWFTLDIPYVAFGLPIAIFLVESYVHSIPKEMEEAATIDGSSFTQTLFRIIMPICVPVLVTVGIIQFFSCWNEFSFALILINKTSLMTVPVGLTLFKGQYSADYPKMMTAMFISILPAIILYFAFSKQIIKGMVTGAVKG
jgi:raffinose/stachyose/melibiose transport system permease protein